MKIYCDLNESVPFYKKNIILVPNYVVQNYNSKEKRIKASLILFKNKFQINYRSEILKEYHIDKLIEIEKEDFINLEPPITNSLLASLDYAMCAENCLMKEEILEYLFELIKMFIEKSKIEKINKSMYLLKRLYNTIESAEYMDYQKILKNSNSYYINIKKTNQNSRYICLKNKKIAKEKYLHSKGAKESNFYEILFSTNLKKEIDWWKNNLDKEIKKDIDNSNTKIKRSTFYLIMCRKEIIEFINKLSSST